MQPIIYNSLDANAPKLDIVAGSLKTVLKACLVTGYGSKAGAGWEIVWEDAVANKIAIRSKNPTSIKSVLLVNDNAAASATVTAYTGWDSATNAGVEQFDSGYFIKDFKQTGGVRGWFLLATDKFFYLIVQTEAGGIWYEPTGFGDAKSLVNNKQFSASMLHRSKSYDVGNTGHAFVKLQNNSTAYFPNNLFDNAQKLWGDGYKMRASKIAVLSECVLHNEGSPYIQLYGMLMPHVGINYSLLQTNGVSYLNNQLPFLNPIVAVQQAFNGRIWIHTDDWGQ